MPTKSELKELARSVAERVGIPFQIFDSWITQESGYRAGIVGARTRHGRAQGILQIIPKFHPGVNPLDPKQSLEYGAQHLKGYYDKYGNYSSGLAAWYGGASAVNADGSIRVRRDPLNPNAPTTVTYASQILGRAKSNQETLGTEMRATEATDYPYQVLGRTSRSDYKRNQLDKSFDPKSRRLIILLIGALLLFAAILSYR